MNKRLNELYLLYKGKYEYFDHKNHQYIMMRIFILILFILLIIAGIKIPAIQAYFIMLLLVLLFLFIMICMYHDRCQKQKKYYQLSLDIIHEYEKRIDNTWNDFDDIGKEFMDEEQDFLSDLDIVGKNSLFQFLNIAKSYGGRKKLMERLSNHNIDAKELKSQQDAIVELTNDLEFCISFQVMLREEQGMNVDLIKKVEALDIPTSHHKIELAVNIVLSVITFIIVLLVLVGMIHGTYLVMMMLIQLSYGLIIHGIFRNELDVIQSHSKSFSHLYQIFHMIEEYSFSSTKMKELTLSIHKGRKIVKEFNKVYDLDTFRYHFLGYIIGNGLFPLNSYILYSFHKAKTNSLDDLKESIQSFEELESSISLSTIGVCKKNICMPGFKEDIQLAFQNIKHPLLNEDICIDNSFECHDNIIIITGSNMSGKTSFMRTIGMNLILMYAGTFVNASLFEAPYLKILTSMRVSDDIDKGISTFYGELLRMKKMIDCQKNDIPMIIFIDEIFKGTNYNDRIYGAKKVIEKLGNEKTILFMTTHDFELCDIDNSKIENYYFEEYYKGDQIQFDYKIKKGKCHTTNAKYLMKQIGIIE